MLTTRRGFRIQLLLAALMCALTLVTYSPHKTQAAGSAGKKITICHRTHATTNPYRRITVNISSIYNGPLTSMSSGGGGHGQFSHNDWITSDTDTSTASRPNPNVYNPNTTYPSNKKRWGDIIPANLDDGTAGGKTATPLNFTDAGLAIYNNTSYNGVAAYKDMCKRKSAKAYCDAEVQALVDGGMTTANAQKACMEDLKEQGATDDAPLKEACKGNIATCSFTALSTFGTNTGGVTCTSGNATFEGTTNMGTLTGVPSFVYNTDEFLAGTQTAVTASPGSVTGAKLFSGVVNSLAAGVYYYKALVTGTDADESVVEGDIQKLTMNNDGTCSSTGTTQQFDDKPVEFEPETTTTTAPPGGYKGALRGRVWIDKNLNQVQDSDEPGLPYTPLVATLTASSVGGTAGTKITFKTDGLGKYDVPLLEPGKWEVRATLQTDALTKTFDTNDEVGVQSVRAASLKGGSSSQVHKSSLIDWVARGTVPVNGQGVADFAAAGDAVLKVAIEVPAECSKSDSVEITWAGIDLKLDTKDDATFVVKTKDKEATVKRIPYGIYSVTPICPSGLKLLGQQTVLRKKQTRAITVKATVLPATGQSNTRGLAEAGLFLVLAGFVIAKRRRVVA